MMNIFLRSSVILFTLIVLVSCLYDDSTVSYVKVFKYDRSVQCENSGVAIDAMALELINIGVDVICSQKGHDGLVRAYLCGENTGIINIYKINKTNLIDAKNIGFESVSELSEYQDEKCE